MAPRPQVRVGQRLRIVGPQAPQAAGADQPQQEEHRPLPPGKQQQYSHTHTSNGIRFGWLARVLAGWQARRDGSGASARRYPETESRRGTDERNNRTAWGTFLPWSLP